MTRALLHAEAPLPVLDDPIEQDEESDMDNLIEKEKKAMERERTLSILLTRTLYL